MNIKIKDYGLCWYGQQAKPYIYSKEIKKGKNKGKLEVYLTRGRAPDGTIIRGRRVIISKSAIITPDASQAQDKG